MHALNTAGVQQLQFSEAVIRDNCSGLKKNVRTYPDPMGNHPMVCNHKQPLSKQNDAMVDVGWILRCEADPLKQQYNGWPKQ